MARLEERVSFGRRGEALAEAHLIAKGYHLLARRFRLRNGEIDLVMRDGPTIVFVEVRRRSGSRGGDPFESIGVRKRHHLIRSARLFLAFNRMDDSPCRFDAVAVTAAGDGAPVIEHRIDAFRADGLIS
jgi:putative endonuclease